MMKSLRGLPECLLYPGEGPPHTTVPTVFLHLTVLYHLSLGHIIPSPLLETQVSKLPRIHLENEILSQWGAVGLYAAPTIHLPACLSVYFLLICHVSSTYIHREIHFKELVISLHDWRAKTENFSLSLKTLFRQNSYFFPGFLSQGFSL